MYMSDAWEKGILLTLTGVPYVAPGNVFLTLSSTDPTDAGTAISEPGYAGFTRMPLTLTPPAAMSGGMGVSNETQIKFAVADADQATATHVAVFNSQNVGTGTMLCYAKLTTPKPIRAGQEPTLRVGEAKFWFVGNATNAFMTDILNTLRGESLGAIAAHATLFNGAPDSGGQELVGGSFVRQRITFGQPVALPSGQQVITNSSVVEFPIATSQLGNYNTDVICDAATEGKPLLFFTGANDIFAQGDSVSYAVDQIQVALN